MHLRVVIVPRDGQDLAGGSGIGARRREGWPLVRGGRWWEHEMVMVMVEDVVRHRHGDRYLDVDRVRDADLRGDIDRHLHGHWHGHQALHRHGHLHWHRYGAVNHDWAIHWDRDRLVHHQLPFLHRVWRCPL